MAEDSEEHCLVQGNGSAYMCQKCSMVGDISDLRAIPCAAVAEAAGKAQVEQYNEDEALAQALLQEEMDLCASMMLALELEVEEQTLRDLVAEEEALKKLREQKCASPPLSTSMPAPGALRSNHSGLALLLRYGILGDFAPRASRGGARGSGARFRGQG